VEKRRQHVVRPDAGRQKKRLYERILEPGYAQEATLRIPKKYGMTFRFKSAEGCWTREPPYKFLTDDGVSDDIEGKGAGRPRDLGKVQAAEGATQAKHLDGRAH
jgi:hypothetical protein